MTHIQALSFVATRLAQHSHRVTLDDRRQLYPGGAEFAATVCDLNEQAANALGVGDAYREVLASILDIVT